MEGGSIFGLHGWRGLRGKSESNLVDRFCCFFQSKNIKIWAGIRGNFLLLPFSFGSTVIFLSKIP